jgi:hypothetical protein
MPYNDLSYATKYLKLYGRYTDEQKANLLKSGSMARPRLPDPALTREELANLRRRLSMLSIDGLERQYKEVATVFTTVLPYPPHPRIVF